MTPSLPSQPAGYAMKEAVSLGAPAAVAPPTPAPATPVPESARAGAAAPPLNRPASPAPSALLTP
eukprot:6407754-Alexandrium_andersonii.AAC.1